MNPQHTLVREHIKAGGRAVVLEAGMGGQMITIYDHGAHIPLLWTHLIPATVEGKATHNVQNAMFAAAMAFSLGIKLDAIRMALRTFDTTFFQAPGRLNVYDDHPFKVILDYGHNPAAVRVMADLANRLKVSGRRLCVLAGPGDRRDEDLREMARIAAKAFDHVILRRDDDLRGRRSDEVPRLMEQELLAQGFPAERTQVIPDEQKAIAAALQMARRGDLLLIFADHITRSWKQVIYFKGEPGDAAATAPSPLALDPHAFPGTQAAGGDLGGGGTLIQDERGVRLARETED
jgi:cyanophycin synthetase